MIENWDEKVDFPLTHMLPILFVIQSFCRGWVRIRCENYADYLTFNSDFTISITLKAVKTTIFAYSERKFMSSFCFFVVGIIILSWNAYETKSKATEWQSKGMLL